MKKTLKVLWLKFKIWRLQTWFSIRYPVNRTYNLTWITEFNIHLKKINKIRKEINK